MVVRGTEERRTGSDSFLCAGWLGGDKNILELVMNTTQHCKILKSTELYTHMDQTINFMLCEFYINKKLQ